jgi:hypothetical protein
MLFGAEEGVDRASEEPVPMVRERTHSLKAVVAAPTLVSSPSTPPWTQEVDSIADQPLDEHLPIPGVHRAMSRTGRLVATVSVGVALMLCIVAGLHAVSAERERRADEARMPEALAAAAAAPHADSIPLAPAATGNAEPLVVTPPSAASNAQGEGDVSQETATGAGAGGAEFAPGALPVENEVHPGRRSPLVAAAEQALVRGATDRALALAGQAVAATPTDADAWLTLAAAHRASGDDGAARADYRKCIAQARTESVNHCRVLAAH